MLPQTRRPRRAPKGNSFAEYALLFALLGGLSVTMVLHFGTQLSAWLQSSTDLQRNLFAHARGAHLAITSPTLPSAPSNTPYRFDLNTLLESPGFSATDDPPTWTAGALPAGLSLGSDGWLEGVPEVGTHTFEATARRGQAQISSTFVITVGP